ncbi:MAG: hypothetical protein LBI43_01700 [Streptococcaceae bacterium]|jgi:hypothetical protein|nr:hypothetical protein [Streptococcaceae bacterium]
MAQEPLQMDAALDAAFRSWLPQRFDFEQSLAMISAFSHYAILAPSQIFTVSMGNLHVLPVFTTQSAWNTFMAKLPDVQSHLEWQMMSFFELVTFVDSNGIALDAYGFNLHTSTDPEIGNMAILEKSEVGQLTILGNVVITASSQDNLAKEPRERLYLVPCYQAPEENGQMKRVFSTMRASDDRIWIPAFDSVENLGGWFTTPGFGDTFRQNHGIILGMTLEDIQHPTVALHVLKGISGIAVNALNFAQNLLEFDKPKTLDDLRNFNREA